LHAGAHNEPVIRGELVQVQVPLSDQVDVAGFHSEATRLLGQQVPPDTVSWTASPAQAVEEQEVDPGRAAIRNRAARAIIPQSFIRMSELVVMHRDPQRFDLLYRSLWRLVYEPDLKNDFGDVDLGRLRQMAQAVRRDIQKMKGKLVFRSLHVRGAPMQVAWYEPAHYICETVGGWLAKRDAAAHWILLTPGRSMRWDGQKLLSAPAVAPMQNGGTIADSDWGRVLDALPWN
jgi:probable DNA metabolism protein